MSNSNFNTYPPQSERSTAADNASFGMQGDVTSRARFPADSSSYPNANLDHSRASAQPRTELPSVPDPAFSGTSTGTGDAANYRDSSANYANSGVTGRSTLAREPTGAYGGRASGATDESMSGSNPITAADRERKDPSLIAKAERAVGGAVDKLGLGKH
ncbi:hypothetical protein AURDEDRAFT_157295 [Auricularia subglabra TFB-10046 SS5]|nr:hypothetical protein AURDEDRAFT_157295 [Auricularia subglabra TFB-10046 SS5]